MSILSSLQSALAGIARERWQINDPVLIRSSIIPVSSGLEGDIAIALALKIAGRVGIAPMDIAHQLADDCVRSASAIIDSAVVAAPGYINVTMRRDVWSVLLNDSSQWSLGAQVTAVPEPKRVIIDYSSPNIAKPMSVAHLRSTIIGDALAKFYERAHWDVTRWNHLGDWGTQFGKMIVAIRKRHKESEVASMTIDQLLELYVWFHDQAKADPSLEEAAREETKKLQQGDQDNKKIWTEIVETSKRAFRRIYHRLDIQIDHEFGESEYQPRLEATVQLLLDSGIARESEGAIVVDLENQSLPTVVIKKGDGAYLYMTTDVASAEFRQKKYHADRLVYVVANQQSLHFQQLFSILEKLGWFHADQLYHIKFGMVLGPDGKKLATREGKAIGLNDVIEQSITLAHKLINEDVPEAQRDAIASMIGIGALKYNDLSHNRNHDIAFDWDRALNLHGNSAPYLQYVCVRIDHIIERVHGEYGQETAARLFNDHTIELHYTEQALLRWLVFSSQVVDDVLSTHEPHRCADYLYELGKRFHAFYEQCSVLNAPNDSSRLLRYRLCIVVRTIIADGLNLLGISVPPKM